MIRCAEAIAPGVVLALLLAALPANANAPHPEPMRTPGRFTAVSAVRYALAHAPALLAQRATIANLDATFTKARAAEYPSILGQLQNQIQKQSNLNGSFAQFGVQPVSNFSQNTAQITSTYNLYNGTQQLTAQQAKRMVEQAKFDLRRQEEQTAVDVSNGFYSLVAKREVIFVAENDLKYQQALLDSARASQRVGRVAGVDVLRAEVSVGKSESNLLQAQTDEQNARETLAVQIGAPAESAFDLPAQVPHPALPQNPTDSLVVLAKVARPEIASARANFDAALLGDALVDTDLRPTVQLQAAFGSQVSPTLDVDEQQEIDESNASAIAEYNLLKGLFPSGNIPPPVLLPPVSRNKPGFWEFGIISNFQAPILDYGQRAASHHATKAQIDAAAASLYSAYDTVEADVRASVRNGELTQQQLALAVQSAQLATESARIAQLQYRSGVISFTDADQTEQTAVQSANDLVSARVSYVVAVIKLRMALGPPDPATAADLSTL
jgi:outer membrane protein TolC